MATNKRILIVIAAFASLAFVVWLYPNIVTYNFENIGNGTESTVGKDIRREVDKIVQYIIDESWPGLYDASATEFRDGNSVEDIAIGLQQYTRSFAGIQDVEIVEIFLADMDEHHWMGTAYSIPPIVPSKVLPPVVSLNSPIVGQMAFVLCESKTDNGTWPSWLTIVLKKESRNWRHLQFFIGPAMLADHDGQWFWNKAKEFDSAGQHRNATIYYGIAYKFLDPSPAIRPYSAEQIRIELTNRSPLNMPHPGRRSAENWIINDDLTVSVRYVGAVVTGVILWLEVRYLSLLDDIESEEASIERKQVHDYVVKTFPEYKNAFGGIYIGSVQQGGQGNRDGFPFDETGPSLTPNWKEPLQ